MVAERCCGGLPHGVRIPLDVCDLRGVRVVRIRLLRVAADRQVTRAVGWPVERTPEFWCTASRVNVMSRIG